MSAFAPKAGLPPTSYALPWLPEVPANPAPGPSLTLGFKCVKHPSLCPSTSPTRSSYPVYNIDEILPLEKAAVTPEMPHRGTFTSKGPAEMPVSLLTQGSV